MFTKLSADVFSSRAAFAGASLLTVTTLLLAGCSSIEPPVAAPKAVAVTGNWQVASNATAASKLPSISGELTGNSASMNGIFHSNSANACIAPRQSFEVSGSADSKMHVTLTSTGFAGGTLTINGTLAADGKSLNDATYNVNGGACAFAAPATATAQSYSSITGNYTGSMTDGQGNTLTLNAVLTQTPESDTDGNFQLSGTGTFPSNPCFNSPVSISNSQVTGGSFDLTYADAMTGNSVDVQGTFSPDGNTLAVTQWVLTGSCGPDTGSGSLTRQQ